MAYCDRCGAYIPDGWTACPGCGYDKEKEAAQAQQAAAAQAHQAEQEKYAREEAEKRRAQRQAYDKVWAENEQRRRREEEEFRRRQQEQEERSRQEQEQRRKERERRSQEQDEGPVRVTVDPDGTKRVRVGDKVHVIVNPDGSRQVEVGDCDEERFHVNSGFDFDFGKAGDKVRDFVNSDAFNKAEETFSGAGRKILPLISYLGPLCFLPLIVGRDRFTSFHARQGLRLFIWSAILEAVGSFVGIGWAVGFFQILMAVIGIKNVINGEEKKLPYIGG